MGEWVLGLVCPGMMLASYLFIAAIVVTAPRANSHHWDD